MARLEGSPANLPGEEWQAIEGFPGYEVSSLGRLRIVRVLRSHLNGGGYEQCGLYDALGKQRQQRVHRTVCAAFHGEAPPGHTHVAHLDGNPLNNCADNLAWATPVENERHKLAHGTRYERGTSNGKLCVQDVLDIRARKKRGEGSLIIAADYGVDKATVTQVSNRRSWAWVEEEERS